MKAFFLIAILAFISMSCHQPKWELAWSDEFDAHGLPDSSKWNYEEGFVRNNEAQNYMKARMENTRIENGTLIIEARRESESDSSITSASMITKGKKDFLYGRIEVKAKLPTGVGTWPAIWLLGNNIGEIGWPDCGEIDIMENVGFDPDTIHANIHTKAYNHVMGTNKGNKIGVKAPFDDFHVYAVEWFADSMNFFVDDQKYFSFMNEKTGNDAWPFDKPHYLILNIAIGGGWGGQRGIDYSIFPQQMVVDYVRYYEWK
ncbi:MAG: glycoside hydrolase family 16 protein [Cyclobacteriaceae bacterium]|nr:glycoside hydrolase family 16 protein [Cyclobacteriaceae bacterium]